MDKEELIKKYNINLVRLEKEQNDLSKNLEIKDFFDIKEINKIGAIQNIMVKNQIISAMIVVDKNMEIIEQEYFIDKLRFPFLHGFRAYRELPSMTGVYNKIRDKPDVVIIEGTGINHSRLGMASHFSLVTGIPAIAISDSLFDDNELKGEEIFLNNKKVGKKLITKIGSKPIYVCPGNRITLESAYDLIKNLILPPHKMPEPIHLAARYAKDIKKELKLG